MRHNYATIRWQLRPANGIPGFNLTSPLTKQAGWAVRVAVYLRDNMIAEVTRTLWRLNRKARIRKLPALVETHTAASTARGKYGEFFNWSGGAMSDFFKPDLSVAVYELHPATDQSVRQAGIAEWFHLYCPSAECQTGAALEIKAILDAETVLPEALADKLVDLFPDTVGHWFELPNRALCDTIPGWDVK